MIIGEVIKQAPKLAKGGGGNSKLYDEVQSIPHNGEKQYSTVTVVTVQYYCYSVICLARGSLC